jgi:hypothetical protein
MDWVVGLKMSPQRAPGGMEVGEEGFRCQGTGSNFQLRRGSEIILAQRRKDAEEESWVMRHESCVGKGSDRLRTSGYRLQVPQGGAEERQRKVVSQEEGRSCRLSSLLDADGQRRTNIAGSKFNVLPQRSPETEKV